MWNYVVQPDRPQMTIWRMRCASCITKATNTHSEYVIHIAFPQPQWLRERASILCHKYEHIAYLVEAVQKVHKLYSSYIHIFAYYIEDTVTSSHLVTSNRKMTGE